jgi:hypothetical protein
LEVLGWPWLYDQIHHLAEIARGAVTGFAGFIGWAVTAFLDGVFGLALGLVLIPVVTKAIGPLIAAVTGRTSH